MKPHPRYSVLITRQAFVRLKTLSDFCTDKKKNTHEWHDQSRDSSPAAVHSHDTHTHTHTHTASTRADLHSTIPYVTARFVLKPRWSQLRGPCWCLNIKSTAHSLSATARAHRQTLPHLPHLEPANHSTMADFSLLNRMSAEMRGVSDLALANWSGEILMIH